MELLNSGPRKRPHPLGTVMTDEAYRRQGLAKKLMDHVVNQYKDSCDGFYLFANLYAVDFYDKCGFSREMEYHYSVKMILHKSQQENFYIQ